MQTDILRLWRKFLMNVTVSGQATISRQYIVDKRYYLYASRPSLLQKLARKCVQYFKFDNMTEGDSILDPPDAVRGMKILDRSLFKKTVSIPGLAVPHKSVTKLTKSLKNEILRFRSIQPVVDLNIQDKWSKSHKLVLFNPLKIKTVDDFNEKQKCILENLEAEIESFSLYNFDMKYENWGHAEIIKAVLPKEFETVAGFAIVGHIAHLNLRDGTEDYKQLIGQVILDKHKLIKTVVNKMKSIDTEFRNFQMELLAGENNYTTTVKEHGCTFTFDFSKVYWNTKLSTEHTRVVSQMQMDDVAFDVFAGVGPFAVPCGKKGVTVFANDLNPDSYESLKLNVTKNKANKQDNVKCYNMDGRDFIKQVFFKEMEKRWTDPLSKGTVHVLMNLPALAVEFLDSFVGLFTQTSLRPSDHSCMPFIHCYYFSKSDDFEKDTKEAVERVLGCTLGDELEIRQVRNVAPGKEMMCIKFRLPESVLFQKIKEIDGDGPAAKKMCCHHGYE